MTATPAHASCFNPAGNEGDTIYNGGYTVMQYCNGGAWIGIGHVGNLTGGLAGWWKLDDGAGTSAADSSGNNNTGTLQNAPTWTTGMNGGALTFNGSTQGVDVSDAASLQIAGSWTVSTWVNLAAIPTSGAAAKMLVKTTAATNTNYGIALDNNSKCAGLGWRVFFSNTSGTSFSSCYITTVNTGTWYLVTGVWDGTNLVLYLNGVSAATSTPGAVPDSSSGAILVIANPASANVNGTLDDVRVYNRALSAADIRTLYTSTGGESGDINTGLKGYWKFDEASGTVANDSSVNSNIGTATGTTILSGKINNARSFNGSTDVVSASNSASLNITSSAISVSAWAKGGVQGNYKYILGKLDNLGSTGYWLYTGSDGTLYFGVGPAAARLTTGFGYSWDNNWHLFTGTYDGSTIAIYVDGVLKASVACACGNISDSSAQTLGIGNWGSSPGSSWGFTGTIDEVRVYSRALSPADVLTLYNSTATSCASPAGYAGDEIYNNGANHVMQYCNGASWVKMGPVPGAGTGPGCSNPAGNEGDTIYNNAYRVAQYCDGTNWVAMGGVIPITGLVGWWNFDEGSGTSAADSSGNANTGTLVNAPTWTTSGKINGALTFNGTNQYVNIANTINPSQITVSAWVKSNVAPPFDNNAEYEVYSNNLDATGLRFADCFNYPATCAPWFWIRDASNIQHGAYGSTVLNANQWYFLAGTYDGTNVHFYVNGVEASNSPTPAPSLKTSNTSEHIGIHANGSSNPFNGTIDDARVYNRALSAGEIAHLYNGGP